MTETYMSVGVGWIMCSACDAWEEYHGGDWRCPCGRSVVENGVSRHTTAASLPPSAETRAPYRCAECEFTTIAGFDAARHERQTGHRFAAIADFASAPPAGSGETEDIRELCAFVLQDFVHHPECSWVLDGKKCDCGVVEQGERAKRILSRLAAHPAGTTREEG